MAKSRLNRIVTKTGDSGQTGLADGHRVAKDSPIIEALGAIDELNASIGMVRASVSNDALQACLVEIQQRLFDLGGELSLPGSIFLKASHVWVLDQKIEEWNKHLPPLKEFILPGSDTSTALLHMARTICRRAERRLVSVANNMALNPYARQYINRLSDYLFVMIRVLEQDHAEGTLFWTHD